MQKSSTIVVWQVSNNNSHYRCCSESYSEPIQTSKMELFGKIVNGFSPLTIFAKSYILDVWLGSENASAVDFDQVFAQYELDINCFLVQG